MSDAAGFDRIVDDSSYPAELRAKALELLWQSRGSEAEQATKAEAERRNSRLELLRILVNPTIAVALIGIVTLLITQNFNTAESVKASSNAIELEGLKAENEKLTAELVASSTLRLEERKFQFDVIKSALSESKESDERAAALKFLSEIGILAGLDQAALERWAEDSQSLPSFETTVGGTGSVIHVPRSTADQERAASLMLEAVRTKTVQWMGHAIGELGVTEATGPDSSADIMRYAQETGLADIYTNDAIPWSGLLVAWVMTKAGFSDLPQTPLTNRAWASWGKKIPDPDFGALAIFWRGSPTAFTGHAGFVVSSDINSIEIISGNVNNRVGLMRIPRDRLLAIVVPNEFPTP